MINDGTRRATGASARVRSALGIGQESRASARKFKPEPARVQRVTGAYFSMPYAYLDDRNLSDDVWAIRTVEAT